MTALRKFRNDNRSHARARAHLLIDFYFLEKTKQPPKTKEPSGGQPDGSSYMGAGVDGRSRQIQPRWGGMTAPTFSSRVWPTGRSTRWRIFLTSSRANLSP